MYAAAAASSSMVGTVRKEIFEDVAIDADPNRVFKAWMDTAVLFQKICSDNVHKSCCYQGDHQVEGGAVEVIYPPGIAGFARKDTSGRDVFLNTLVDYEKRLLKYELTEGEVKDSCKFYRGTFEVVPAESGSKSIAKHAVEFEQIDDTDFSSAWREKLALLYLHRIEQYLKANPTEYTS